MREKGREEGEVKGRIVAAAMVKGERRLEGKARQVFTHKETERESHGHWLRHSGMHQVSSAFAFRDQIYIKYARVCILLLHCETSVEDTPSS